MSTLQVVEIIIGSVVSFGILIAGVGYAVGQFKKGESEGKMDDTSVKQGVFDLLQKEVTALEKMVADDEKEMAVLKTQVDEKDKKVKEFMEILQNRNPELTNYITTSYSYMKDTGLFFTEMKDVLRTLADKLRESNERTPTKPPQIGN
jgi:hypothetical protein